DRLSREVAGGTNLDAHTLAFQISGAVDIRRARPHHDDLSGLEVGVGEVDAVQPFFRNGHGGDYNVELPCVQSGEQAVPGDVGHLYFDPHDPADGFDQLDIEADDPAGPHVHVLKGSKRRVRCHP